MDKLFELENKVAVVTGGMGQLGIAYSVGLTERGATVAILDLASEPVARNEAFLRGMERGRIRAFVVDITNRQAVENIAGEIVASMGSPHVLINNAALDSPPDAPPGEVGPYEHYPEDSFDSVLAVNIKGTHVCCQVFGRLMAEAGRGSIINVCSIYGILSPCQDIYDFRRRDGEDFYKPVAYSVSKSAILNLTRYLATYWAKKGVRVNTLTPGGIFNDQPREFLDAYCPRVPMGRMADANELLGAIVFLSSDASSYVTGSNLVVDGGWSAW